MESDKKFNLEYQPTTNDFAIRVSGLSKQYQIGGKKKGSLVETLSGIKAVKNSKKEEFLALKNVNLEVKKGEVIGIIGKNGAGKSTLLKILSRITQPTTGKIEINGRVASLLEVGTGFHPELTGRENIFLNGTILGMSRKEIKYKFEEIVEFSGVRKFIDTPVKHYSSGMYVRLAFAVAAHLEPEILIIDEVLAVGDAEFQKKCLGKMKEVAGEGRTVLFVSHNMVAVKSLCNRSILLENGEVKMNGDTNLCVQNYLSGENYELKRNIRTFKDLGIDGLFELKKVSIHNEGSIVEQSIEENKPILLTTEFVLKNCSAENYLLTFHLINELGEPLFSFSSGDNLEFNEGNNKAITIMPANFLQSGNYSLNVYLVEDKRKSIFKEMDLLSFTVIDGRRELGVYMGKEPGYIRPNFDWRHG